MAMVKTICNPLDSDSVLTRTVKMLQRSYPMPEKVYMEQSEWVKLRDEMEQYCLYTDTVGPLSADNGVSNILVMGVPICVQECAA